MTDKPTGFSNGNQVPAYGNEKSAKQIILELQAEIEQLKEANYQRAKIANNVFQKEIEQLQADNENMKAALEEIMEVVGTSSLQHKIAREALK